MAGSEEWLAGRGGKEADELQRAWHAAWADMMAVAAKWGPRGLCGFGGHPMDHHLRLSYSTDIIRPGGVFMHSVWRQSAVSPSSLLA